MLHINNDLILVIRHVSVQPVSAFCPFFDLKGVWAPMMIACVYVRVLVYVCVRVRVYVCLMCMCM